VSEVRTDPILSFDLSCSEKIFPLVQDFGVGFLNQFVFFHQSGCAADPFMDAAGSEPVAAGLSLLSACCQLLCDHLAIFFEREVDRVHLARVSTRAQDQALAVSDANANRATVGSSPHDLQLAHQLAQFSL